MEFFYKNFYSIKFKKSLLYWLETYKQIDRLACEYINADNFYVIPLNDLQKNSKYYLKKILY